MEKIQLQGNQDSTNHALIRRLNAFSEISCVFTAADTATTFTHGLGKLPQHAISRIQDKAGSVYATSADVASWSKTSVVLRCSNSQVTATVKIE